MDEASTSQDDTPRTQRVQRFQPYTPITKTATSLKRKRDHEDQDGDSKALQEYLDVMKPPTKSKTWANEDASGAQKEGATQGPSLDTTNITEDEDLDTGSRKKERKKKKKESRSAKHMSADVGPAPQIQTKEEAKEKVDKKKKKKSKDKSLAQLGSKGGKSLDANEDVPQEPQADPDQLNIQASDTDWLRSKTSRLLGLLDDDDEVGDMNSGSQIGPLSRDDSTHADTRVTSSEIDGANGGDGNDQYTTTSHEESEDANVTNIRTNGRLFIRNLPYDADDSDLHDTFSRYGKLEEVWICSYLFFPTQ